MAMTLLELQNVSYENEGEKILENISISVAPGDFISVVGPSGSGKSTFFKLCSHLISPTQGKILFKNRDFNSYNPPDLRKSIAYCFQTPGLFGNTVMDNVSFPFAIRNLKLDFERVKQLFSLFQMTIDFLTKDVKNLSGGEKQRIALIRSLIFPPEILLLDEVTSALDAENTKIVETVISQLNKEGITILWITHSPEQSRQYAQKVLTIDAGEIKALEVIK